MSKEESFQIKTLNNKHTCVRDYNAKIVTSSWLATEYARKLRNNPAMKLKKIVRPNKFTILLYIVNTINTKNTNKRIN